MDQVGIQSAHVKEADHARIVKEAREHYNLNDVQQLGWAKVNKERLRVAEWMKDNIPAIQTPMTMDREAIEHGGIILRIGKSARKRTNDLFAKTMLSWATQINADQDTYGFAIAMTAPPQAGIRALFNKDQDSFDDVGQQIFAVCPLDVDVFHKRNTMGEHLWVVCKPSNSSFSSLQPIPIPGCLVFWRRPPDEAGMPRSTVLSLLPAYQWLEEMKACALVAARKRSAPPLVTERVMSQKDPQIHGILPSGGCDTDESKTTGVEEITMKERVMDRMVRLENAMGGAEKRAMEQVASILSTAAAQVQAELTLGERFDLPAERKLARQLQAEGPGMDLQKLQIHFEQVALMAFVIPPGEIQPESTHGKMVSNDNIKEVYNRHLSYKKQKLVLAIEVMLRRVYQAGVSMKYLRQNKESLMAGGKAKYKESLVELIKERTAITVELANIPDEASMISYYQSGWLKYEALRDYLSTKHGLPLDSFEDAPKLTQMDLLTQGKSQLEQQKLKQQQQQGKKRKKPSS